MESTIDILPQEVLHNVFSKLSVPERLNACLVCKKWLGILNCKSLLKDTVVHISDNRHVPVFSSMSRDFLNFSFKFIIVDNKYHDLFRRFSSNIEYLSFEKCGIWKREPVNFDDVKYDNLKVLRIIDCELWTLFPCLPNLSELYLTGKGTITDDGLAILQKTMKHLKILGLLCPVSCEQRVFRRFYPQQMTYETNPSSLILSLPAVRSFISERASTLKEMHLWPEITSLALKDISSIKDLCLYKIELDGYYDCADGLVDLFKNQPTLKVVNLNNLSDVNDYIVHALCLLLPEVEEILIHSFRIVDMSLSKLFQLTKLSKLDIGGGQNVPDYAFNEAILNFKAIQIKSLNLSNKIQHPEFTALDVLFKQCKYLVYLNLSGNEIPDRVIHIISKYLVHLEYLYLMRCRITDYGLTGHKAEHLLFGNTEEKDGTSLSNLKCLRELGLNGCDKITDNAVIDTIKFEYLEFLYVSECKLQLGTVQILLLQNPSIKKIYWDDNDLEHPKIEEERKIHVFDDSLEPRFVDF